MPPSTTPVIPSGVTRLFLACRRRARRVAEPRDPSSNCASWIDYFIRESELTSCTQASAPTFELGNIWASAPEEIFLEGPFPCPIPVVTSSNSSLLAP